MLPSASGRVLSSSVHLDTLMPIGATSGDKNQYGTGWNVRNYIFLIAPRPKPADPSKPRRGSEAAARWQVTSARGGRKVRSWKK